MFIEVTESYGATGKKFGGGLLTAVRDKIKSYRRLDLETYAECVWFELSSLDGFNYIVGSDYFFPLSDANVFIKHLTTLKQQIHFSKFKVYMYGDFNLPGVNWSTGISSSGNNQTVVKVSRLVKFIKFDGLTQPNYFRGTVGNVFFYIFFQTAL